MNRKAANIILVIATAVCFYFVLDDSSKKMKGAYQKESANEKMVISIHRDAVKGGYRLVDAVEFELLMKRSKPVLIDTRSEKKYVKGHVRGAVNFHVLKEKGIRGESADDLKRILGNEKKKLIIFYGEKLNDISSHKGAIFAVKEKFTNVVRFSGGVYSYRGAGFKLEKPGK